MTPARQQARAFAPSAPPRRGRLCGATWSTEQILRDDGPIADLGYPDATEVESGRVFTACYFTKDDGSGFGGTRYIVGSTFRLG